MSAIVNSLKELERYGREGQLSGAAQWLTQAHLELDQIRGFLANQIHGISIQPVGKDL